MKITLVGIQNFRKLQKVKIDFSGQQTVLVGANNSGKTSAMDALIFF
ncbi:AAA family ATPase [Paraglaciecola sp. 20A4]|nr:AAA family ATPase [Paraglaciecola sp. 20A4]